MLRWRWVWFWWVIGSLITGYGILVEMVVRSEEGSGFYRGLANTFYGGMISDYRWLSMVCVLVGPGIMVLAFTMRCRWNHEQHATFLEKQAEKTDRKAERLASRPEAGEAVDRKLLKLDKRSTKLRIKASRLMEKVPEQKDR